MDDPLRAQGSEEERLEKFREVRDLIEARVRRWLIEHRYKSAQPLSTEAAPVGDGAA
jgi:hypothetical protein